MLVVVVCKSIQLRSFCLPVYVFCRIFVLTRRLTGSYRIISEITSHRRTWRFMIRQVTYRVLAWFSFFLSGNVLKQTLISSYFELRVKVHIDCTVLSLIPLAALSTTCRVDKSTLTVAARSHLPTCLPTVGRHFLVSVGSDFVADNSASVNCALSK